MQIPKPTDADKAYFRALLPDDDGIQVKPMFCNLGAFVNNNMFAGLFGAVQLTSRWTPHSDADIDRVRPARLDHLVGEHSC
jgi:hypothetical protein